MSAVLLLFFLCVQAVDARPTRTETIVIECPGLRCAACRLGVLRSPERFPEVRTVDFDVKRSLLIVQVDPGFERHAELVSAVQSIAEPIEMFRAVLLRPRQVFLYLDEALDEAGDLSLRRSLRAIPGVKSAVSDPRNVIAIALEDETDRTRILACARAAGRRGELFETRYAANVGARISEESHHVIGVLVLLLSFLLLVEKIWPGTLSWPGWVVPGLWLVGGLLVVVVGDLDSWPFQRSLADSIQDRMILQHKLLGLGMMLLGVSEYRQRRNRGWRYGPVTLFLAVAALSGIMLQFHVPNMVDPAHLKAWELVNRQHLAAAIVGGLALTARALSDYGLVRSRRFGYAWPLLLGAEGILLCLFVEPVW